MAGPVCENGHEMRNDLVDGQSAQRTVRQGSAQTYPLLSRISPEACLQQCEVPRSKRREKSKVVDSLMLQMAASIDSELRNAPTWIATLANPPFNRP